MNLLKEISLDLAHVNGGNVLRFHEGDKNSCSIVVSVYNKGAAYYLTGKTIKYDATIAGHLAENDAIGSAESNEITIPVTENMTAMDGKLLIDIKIIDEVNNEETILFTQTVEALVQKSVINGATIIDISGTTIAGRLDALDEKFPVGTADIADDAVTAEKIASGVIPTKISDLTNDSNFQIKQSSIPEVRTVQHQSTYIPDVTDPVFTALAIGQYFYYEPSEDPHFCVKMGASEWEFAWWDNQYITNLNIPQALVVNLTTISTEPRIVKRTDKNAEEIFDACQNGIVIFKEINIQDGNTYFYYLRTISKYENRDPVEYALWLSDFEANGVHNWLPNNLPTANEPFEIRY